MFHSVYVQKRQPGVTYRDFQRLWRSHGDFAATVPAFWRNVARYIHNDPVEDSAGLPNISVAHDAVGELFYTSLEAWLGMRDVMWREVAPDEARVFAGPPLSVRGERRVHQPPTGPIKLFTLGRPRAGLAPAEFDRMADAYVAAARQSPGFGAALAGLTVTRAVRPPAAHAMETVPQTASSHEWLVIYHFESEHAARTALASADYARLQVAEDGFLDWDSRLSLLCRGWMLKDTTG